MYKIINMREREEIDREMMTHGEKYRPLYRRLKQRREWMIT